MKQFYSLLLTSLLIAGCAAPTPTVIIPVTGQTTAEVADVAGEVTGRVIAEAPLAPIQVGFELNSGGEIQTGDVSRARLDFSDGSIVRLGANASLIMKGIETATDGNTTTQLQLAFGKLWVSLTGGVIEVETPVGAASVRGSFAIMQFDPQKDQLQVDCLEGSCTADTAQGFRQLGNLERLIVDDNSSSIEKLTAEDVQQFINDNPESAGLAATLTAAPPATDTPVSVATLTQTTTATAPLIEPATDSPTNTASVTVTAALATTRPAATNTAAANFAVIGTHIVRAGETLNCIGRGYGVLPSAIASANGFSLTTPLTVNQALRIPAAQWTAILPGPACPPQFTSPYPGLATVTATSTHTATATATLPSPTATATATLTTTLLPAATATHTLTSSPTVTVTPTETVSPTATADATQNFGWSVANVSLNGGGNSITVSPSGQFRVQLDYQVWNAVSCPACIAQIVIGLETTAQYCAYDGIPGLYPGVSGNSTYTLTAPTAPGTYTLQTKYDLQFGCTDAMTLYGGGAVIGMVTVQ